MSEERQEFDGVRPYTCVVCARPMRTRGADGRCYECLEPVPQRCRSCYRVRYEPGGDWEHHPGKLLREVEAVCATCEAERHKRALRAYYHNAREVERRQAKGFGPVADGVDVFAGMREGDR